jgi:Na+-translocating ferredoxin:NAD+ oxidoreductase RnfG subunit
MQANGSSHLFSLLATSFDSLVKFLTKSKIPKILLKTSFDSLIKFLLKSNIPKILLKRSKQLSTTKSKHKDH